MVKSVNIYRGMDGTAVISVTVDGKYLPNVAKMAEKANADVQNGKTVECILQRVKKSRSLDANAYAWVLISAVAEKIRASKDEVYFQMLRDYGQGGTVSIEESKTGMFERAYKYHDVLGESELHGKVFRHYRFWVGSSQYSTEEMSIFIDGIVSEAVALDLETKTPDELANIKSLWGNETKQGVQK